MPTCLRAASFFETQCSMPVVELLVVDMWSLCVGTDLIAWMMRSMDVDDTGNITLKLRSY